MTRSLFAFWLRTLSALVALGWVVPLGCNSNPEVLLGALPSGGPCGTNPVSGCGASCEKSADCPSGLYCGAESACTADCFAGTKTREYCGGRSCRPDGTCSSGDTLGLGGGTNNGQGGENGECIDVQVEFTPIIPTVILLIDRSVSMDARDGFGPKVQAQIAAGTYVPWGCPDKISDPPDSPDQYNEDWKWNVLRNVLLNPVDGVVKPLESEVRFGMALYSSDHGWIDRATATKDPTMVCPELIEVEIALGNHAALLDAYECDDLSWDTPTGESLSAVAEKLKAYGAPGPKVVVLATDGAPDTCDCPSFSGNQVPMSCWNANVPDPELAVKADVVARAQAIFENDDIRTFVIGVTGDTGLMSYLAEVATAGGGKLYDGFDPRAIRKAVSEIINGVRSCVIDLDGEISPGKESTGRVVLDGERLGYDDEDGWVKKTKSQIELVGAACSTIKSGDHDLDISFPCGTFVPITK